MVRTGLLADTTTDTGEGLLDKFLCFCIRVHATCNATQLLSNPKSLREAAALLLIVPEYHYAILQQVHHCPGTGCDDK